MPTGYFTQSVIQITFTNQNRGFALENKKKKPNQLHAERHCLAFNTCYYARFALFVKLCFIKRFNCNITRRFRAQIVFHIVLSRVGRAPLYYYNMQFASNKILAKKKNRKTKTMPYEEPWGSLVVHRDPYSPTANE